MKWCTTNQVKDNETNFDYLSVVIYPSLRQLESEKPWVGRYISTHTVQTFHVTDEETET